MVASIQGGWRDVSFQPAFWPALLPLARLSRPSAWPAAGARPGSTGPSAAASDPADPGIALGPDGKPVAPPAGSGGQRKSFFLDWLID